MSNAPHHLPRLGPALIAVVRNLLRDALDPYRPELHYMRGPGPKWRARHGIPEPRAAAVLARPLPAYR